MGDTYSDPAILIREDGSEIPVTANLRNMMNGLHTDWDGVLSAAPQHLVVLANETNGRLRLNDGREGAFVCLDPSTWITAGRANIYGNGDAPF